jgi:16S rRNA (uracil1498-N3)-methyltransferase
VAHFYLSEELTAPERGVRIVIVGSEAKHAVVVSRIQPGETISIGNGAGLMVSGTVVAAAPNELVVEVESVNETAADSPAIWLAQALAKGDRDELAIQAATELGVDGVIPWVSQRSIVRWDGPKAQKGHDRWSSIVREATKQSLRPWLPEVAQLVSTRQLALLAASTTMLILEPTAQVQLSGYEPDGNDIVVVVGPEGGIAPAELDLLLAAGARAVRLGDTVLRTSTAGPAAIALLNARLHRW